MTASRPRFPLPKGHFGPVHLTVDEQNHYREIARARLDAVLQHEHEFTQVEQRQVDPAKWRLVKSKHQLRIYRRRKHSLGEDDMPSMLGVGRMEGTLDDVLYGSYDKSHEEVQMTMSFVDTSTKDCTVLHNIDLATPEDPYHYLGIKWFITQLPASFIIYPRDWCNLEALGVDYDAQGRKFGYFIINSIELKNCPPFDPRVLVRGRTRLSFLYREPVPGIVEIFAHGVFDPAGELIQRFTTTMTSEVLAGIFRVVECAEAKKLTLLALKNHHDKQDAAHTLLECCVLCHNTGSLFSSLKACRVCGTTVCPQCRVRKPIFIGPAHAVRKVHCCQSCIQQAKCMAIRPAEPSCSILGEVHLPEDLSFQSGEFAESSDDSLSEPTPSGTIHDDIDGLSELDEDEYRFSNESGILEADVEQIIASLMREKPGGACLSTEQLVAAVAEPRVEQSRRLPPDHVAILEQMIGLQTAAHRAYAITQANHDMMQKLT